MSDLLSDLKNLKKKHPLDNLPPDKRKDFNKAISYYIALPLQERISQDKLREVLIAHGINVPRAFLRSEIIRRIECPQLPKQSKKKLLPQELKHLKP